MQQQFKRRLSVVLAAVLATSNMAFADTGNTEEQVVNQPLQIAVNDGATTTGSALKVTSAVLDQSVPVRTAYVKGQPLQNDLNLDVTYDDGSEAKVPVTADMFHISNDGATSDGQFTTDIELQSGGLETNSVVIFSPNENGELAQRWSGSILIYDINQNIESSELRLSNSAITKGEAFTPEGVLHVKYNSTVGNYECDYPLTTNGIAINSSSVNTDVAGQYQVTYSLGAFHSGTAYVQVVEDPNAKYVTNVQLVGIKTDYIEGQDFTPQGNFKVTYSDDTEELVPIGLQHLQFISTNVVGNNFDARVMYEGRILPYKINVVAKSVASINIDTDSPLRTTYTVNTPLTTTGAQIVVNWDNGKSTKAPLTNDMVSGYNPEQLGEQTLTVTYEGKTTTFKINVIDAPAKVEPVSVKLINPKTTYYQGQYLTVYNASVTMNDGSIEDVLLLPDAVTGYDETKLGAQELTFSYTQNDVTVTTKKTITVLEDGVVDLGIPYGYKFIMGINDFGTQNLTVRYASGKYESVQLKPENFANLYLEKAWTTMTQLNYGGVTQMVKVEVPLPNKEIDRVEQTGVIYHRLGAPLFNNTPVAIYEVYFTDGTHCKAMYDALTDDAVGNITGVPGIVYFNASLPNGDNFISCIVNTADTAKVGREAVLTFEINNLKDVYSIGDKLGDDIFVSTLADGEEVDVTRITEESLKVEAFDTSSAGHKTLVLNLHNAWNVEYAYSVKDANGNVPASLKTISVKNVTASYKVGDKFDGNGTVVLNMTDDTTSYIKLSDSKVTLTGFDTTAVGKKKVTVTYQGKTTTFEINVTEASSGGSGGGSSSGGSGGGGGGGGATTPAKPADANKPAETKPATPAIPGTTQVGKGDIKITKFEKLTAENLKQVTGFLIPSNKITDGVTLPDGMKAVKVEGSVKNFKDVKNHWAADAINKAVEMGLLNGMTADSYAPKAPLTAEQTFAGLSNILMKHDILNLKMDKAKVQDKLASQLANPTWSTLSTAQVLGNTNEAMLSKYADPKAVKDIVTRGEMANIIFALAGDVFPSDAKTAEEFCKQTGIMVGDANGNFASDRVLSRAELASILLRVDAKISEL